MTLLGDELVCRRCLAGMESQVHHASCVLPAEAAAAEESPFAELEDGEYERISADFHSREWSVRNRDAAYINILLPLAGAIASPGGSREWARYEATQALRRVQQLTLIGEDQAEVDRHV
jgi:hypothetical protein